MTNNNIEIKKRFIEVRKRLNLTQTELANAIGKDKTALSKIESLKEEKRIPTLSIMIAMEEIFNVNRHYIETGEGNMLLANKNGQLHSPPQTETIVNDLPKKQPRLEAVPISLHPHPEDDPTGEAKFIYAPDGTRAMRVKIVPVKAQAGYLRGFGDPEYYEDFESELILVDKEHGGTYLGFEIKGESGITTEPELMRYNIYPGWIAIGRDLPRQKWAYKLHTHNYNYWVIVHKRDGILIKQISNHDVDNGIITAHSLNPDKNLYPDEDINLEDVEQIFNVVQIATKMKK